MSILIDTEMPTSCYDCDFTYQDQDSEHNVYWTCAVIHKSACMYKRRDDYPLIPIPPHGDLIDLDALFKEFEHNRWFGNADRDIAEDVLLDAPIIIMADESKEET